MNKAILYVLKFKKELSNIVTTSFSHCINIAGKKLLKKEEIPLEEKRKGYMIDLKKSAVQDNAFE